MAQTIPDSESGLRAVSRLWTVDKQEALTYLARLDDAERRAFMEWLTPSERWQLKRWIREVVLDADSAAPR